MIVYTRVYMHPASRLSLFVYREMGPRCILCVNNLRHLPFVYLLAEKRGNATFIDMSRTPLESVSCHNREKGYRVGSKCTRLAPGRRWEIVLMIGPFYRGARAFRNEWRKQARKLVSRVRMGIQKSKDHVHTLNVFAKDPAWLEEITDS